MITTEKIYAALKAKLESEFSEIPVQIKDIKSITKPCFYLHFLTEKEERTSPRFVLNQQSFEIIYFAEEYELLEMLKIKSKLNKFARGFLNIDGKTIEIQSIITTLNEDDYYLQATIDFEFCQKDTETQSEEDSKELMNILEI